jgi:hypothetical protein
MQRLHLRHRAKKIKSRAGCLTSPAVKWLEWAREAAAPSRVTAQRIVWGWDAMTLPLSIPPSSSATAYAASQLAAAVAAAVRRRATNLSLPQVARAAGCRQPLTAKGNSSDSREHFLFRTAGSSRAYACCMYQGIELLFSSERARAVVCGCMLLV